MIFQRRTQVFTLISIFIVLIFSIIVTTFVLQIEKETNYVDSKLSSVNTYYSLIKGNYLKTILRSSARNALLAMANHTIEREKFLPRDDDFIDIYRSLLQEGNFSYVDGVHIDCENCEILMENKTLEYWIDMIENNSKNVFYESSSFKITPLYDTLLLTQERPWYVNARIAFNMTMISRDFNITDSNYYISVDVPIFDLPDPLFGVNSGSKMVKKIVPDPDYLNVTSDIWLFDKLNETLFEGYYYRFKDNYRGMSYLMRLQNMTYANQYNAKESYVVSLINPLDVYNESNAPLSKYNTSSLRRSFVDYHFFNDTFNICDTMDDPDYFLFNITGISDTLEGEGFRIDMYNAFLVLQGNVSWNEYLETACSSELGP